MSKRPAEDEAGDTKRIKTEDLLDDDLNSLLDQVTAADDANAGLGASALPEGPIDFNNLPDELLDSVDSMPVPESFGAALKIPDSPRYTRGVTPDFRRTYSQPQMRPQPAAVSAAAAAASNDPTKLNDALAAAGVDINQEEELLQRRPRFGYSQSYASQPQRQGSFLVPYHVASFMQRAAREYGVSQSFYQDLELLEIMSAGCENWLSNVVSKTIIMSRHRRSGIPLVPKGAKGPNAQRSEVSKELKNLANKQKELEERRVNRRMALGLEKSESGKDDSNKVGAEETLHKATNATVAMMTSNPSRKKYSWMTSGANTADPQQPERADPGSKQSQIIAARGDNGLRFREIRTGQSVTMKDLLAAIEDERVGVDRAVVKGYCNLRD